MNQNLDEQMSAFLDGELSPEELELFLAQMDRDPARRAVLARYSMIGEQLRTGVTVPVSPDFAGRVRSAILAEKLDRAPRRKAGPVWAGWVSGAVAAAAALVAVLVAVPFNWRGDPAPQLQAGQPGNASPEAAFELLSPHASRRLSPDAAARLTGYLVAHGSYANTLSRSNFDSRFVFARPERAAWREPRDLNSAR